MSDLDDILEGNDEQPVDAVEATQEPEAPEAPQEAEEAPSGPNRGPDGKFAPKGNEDGAMPAPEGKQVPIDSYQAEKRKRQEWEQRYQQDVETLRRELEELKRPKEPEAPPPSIWDDEQGTFQHYGQQITQTAVQQAQQQARLNTSELLMMQNAEDFSELKQDIYRFVGENPAINAEVQGAPHPWQTAYKAFKSHQTMSQLGATDVTELEAKLREQIKAEMAAQQPQSAQPNIPQSLADAQSSKQGAAQQVNNLSLDDILADNLNLQDNPRREASALP